MELWLTAFSQRSLILHRAHCWLFWRPSVTANTSMWSTFLTLMMLWRNGRDSKERPKVKCTSRFSTRVVSVFSVFVSLCIVSQNLCRGREMNGRRGGYRIWMMRNTRLCQKRRRRSFNKYTWKDSSKRKPGIHRLSLMAQLQRLTLTFIKILLREKNIYLFGWRLNFLCRCCCTNRSLLIKTALSAANV